MTEWYYNFRETLEASPKKAKAFKMLVALIGVAVVGLAILAALYPTIVVPILIVLLGIGALVAIVVGIAWSLMTLNE